MTRIDRRFPQNPVRHWRAIATHAAMGADAALLRPELIAGPYTLLADMVPLTARHRGSLSN